MYIPFLRVSTKQQETDRQLADIRARAARDNWELAPPIAEKISGAKRNAERSGLQQLLQTAHRRDTVVVTELSRLGRTPSELVHLLDELTRRGVCVLTLDNNLASLHEDGKPNHVAQLIYGVLGQVVHMERELTRERVRSGVAQARSNGRIGGRPTTAVKSEAQLLRDYPAVVKLLEAGSSAREVATTTGVARNTVAKVRRALYPQVATS